MTAGTDGTGADPSGQAETGEAGQARAAGPGQARQALDRPDLDPGQAEEISRVERSYPEITDEDFSDLE